MTEDPGSRLKALSDQVRGGGAAPQETVRTLLSWFDAQRRGALVVSAIRQALDDAGLTTEPDFESAYIDSFVQFRSKPVEISGNVAAAAPQVSGSVSGGTPAASADVLPTQSADLSFRLSKLAAANRKPCSVKPDAPLAEAVTLMLSHDYSQLPVMTSDREVKGAVSWRSIATRLSLNRNGGAVRNFMDPVEIVESDASLFDAIRVIVQSQYVLVRDAERRIVGIVTSSDLSAQFHSLTEPFLLLSEIENELRRVLSARFTAAELGQAKDPKDATRIVQSAHDLTFGEYVVLLESPDRWGKLNLPLDKTVFVAQLREVRRIRNDVMHFDPDGIEPNDLDQLRDFSKMMLRLRELGVT